MTLHIKKEEAKSLLMYALLFLASMNFAAKFFYFVFAAFGVLLVQRNTKADQVCVVYLALGAVMAVYNSDEGVMSMIRCLAPFCFYLVGLNLASHSIGKRLKDQNLERVSQRSYMLLFTISAGSFTHYFINYIYNFGSIIGRNTIDIWSGQILAATGQIALTCLMAGLAVSMLYLPYKKWHRIMAVGILVVMLAYNLMLAGRTLLVVLAVLALVGWFYPKSKQRTVKQRIWSFIAAIVTIGLIVTVFATNLFGIRDQVMGSLLAERFDGIESWLSNMERTSAKLGFLKDFWRYPLGGLHLRAQYGYAHDLLLDGYDEYGILGLVGLLAILIMGAAELFKLLRYSTYPKYLKLAMLLVNLAIWMEFMVEPIIEGMPWLLSCYCLINGCMTGMNRAFQRHLEREKYQHYEYFTD